MGRFSSITFVVFFLVGSGSQQWSGCECRVGYRKLLALHVICLSVAVLLKADELSVRSKKCNGKFQVLRFAPDLVFSE